MTSSKENQTDFQEEKKEWMQIIKDGKLDKYLSRSIQSGFISDFRKKLVDTLHVLRGRDFDAKVEAIKKANNELKAKDAEKITTIKNTILVAMREGNQAVLKLRGELVGNNQISDDKFIDLLQELQKEESDKKDEEELHQLRREYVGSKEMSGEEFNELVRKGRQNIKYKEAKKIGAIEIQILMANGEGDQAVLDLRRKLVGSSQISGKKFDELLQKLQQEEKDKEAKKTGAIEIQILVANGEGDQAVLALRRKLVGSNQISGEKFDQLLQKLQKEENVARTPKAS